MNKKISILTISYTIFLIMLFASALLTGIVASIVNLLAFIFPLILVSRMSDDSEKSLADCLKIDHRAIRQTLPLVAPTVSVIILISLATSLLIFAISGRTNSVDVGNSFIYAIVNFALLPAVLEELLFRYLPIKLIAPYSKRGAIIISAFFFSLVHHNLFSIPYALAAGIIFMAIDIALDSIIPSIIIHFINNAISVGMIFFSDNVYFAPTAYVLLGILTVVSIIAIIIRRSEYKKLTLDAFEGGEKIQITVPLLLFAFITLSLAVISLM